MNNNDLIQEYVTTHGLKKRSYQGYKTILNNYSRFQEKSLQDLLDEADDEEENRLRWKKRSLKNRLINYQNYLKVTYNISTAKQYMTIIKSFYRHHEIEIGKLPKFNLNNICISEPIQYSDLPDHEILKIAYSKTDHLMKSLILFISSSGMSKVDALNLTVEDFIIATKKYHNGNKIQDVINQLKNRDDVVPTFKKRRSKTNKYFITFCTPEAVTEIINYLEIRNNKKPLTNIDKLFKISPEYYTKKFAKLNDDLKLGKAGTYNRLRGHMLRKYHASNLEKNGMERYKINVLQGKSNNAVDDVYFFEDENQLREQYIQHMDCLLLFTEIKSVDVYSAEYMQLIDENKLLKEEFKNIKEDVEKIKDWYIF